MKKKNKQSRTLTGKAAAKSRVLANAPTRKPARKAARAPRAKKHHVQSPPRGKAASRITEAGGNRTKAIPPKTTVNNRQRLQTTVNGSLSSFNPALPVDGSLIVAGELRNQFNGLLVMIQSIPAGPPGPQGVPGIQGPPFAQAVIDGVNTLEPGEPAWVSSYFDGTDVHFSFGIPRGYEGAQGQAGTDGQQGETGPQGPPFAQAVIDDVVTVDPGQPAWVTCSFDGTNVHFTFGIPRGADGSNGEPGPPGEVTTAQLDDAINGTSSNTNAVASLGIVVSDPPTQSEVQAVVDKLDELINGLRR